MAVGDSYDVIILGGGLAGLTLAIQIKRGRPQTSVLVAEKSVHPAGEAAHKVGESTSELACYYFAHVLGMKDHLDHDELPKMGLRFFMPYGDNSDITRRVEIGPRNFPVVDTYQLDRGRFENALAAEAMRLGAVFLDECRVQSVTLDPDDGHQVSMSRRGEAMTVTGRWVVDASGRAAILKRQLGLAKPVEHRVGAAWFRIGDRIAIDSWSDSPSWHAEMQEQGRWYSTVHLMDTGYWVWLIPLASGSHSVGIVVDPAFHPFDQMNTFDRAMNWLHTHEPQLAGVLDQKRHLLQDFRVLKHFAYSCEKMYSSEHWCITGEAGPFNDPLYSPGSDNIALSNGFVYDIITHELDGEDIEERAEFFNELFLSAFHMTLPIWEGSYPVFGNAQAFAAKHVLDVITYWGFIALLFYRGKFSDMEYLASVLPDIANMSDLQLRAQTLVRDWTALDKQTYSDTFIEGRGGVGVQFLSELLVDLERPKTDEELSAQISQNLRLLEGALIRVFRQAAQLVGGVDDARAINPYAVSLKPERWDDDGLFDDAERFRESEALGMDIDKIWAGLTKSAQPA